MRLKPKLPRIKPMAAWRARPGPLLRSRLLAVLVCGGAVLLVLWHADTLRLSMGGAGLAWPLFIAFGAGWAARGGRLWRSGAGLVAGSLAAVLGSYGALQLLPVTPFGAGLGLGVAAAALAAAVMFGRGSLPAAPAA